MAMTRLIVILVLLSIAYEPVFAPAQAQNRAAVQKQFDAWLKNDLWPKASAAGVSAASFNAALGGLQLNWQLPDLVPPGSRQQTPRRQSQAEFRSPARYFAPNTVAGVVNGGRARLERLAPVLGRLEREYGVPGRFLIAIWGRESGFGRARIPHNAFEVLATKAFMSTRRDLFEREVLAALVMVERGTPVAAMKSSWAGALGQPQFLPSSYLEHARDGDGDGRADIWNSEADTLASIAHYLAQAGWVRGRDWGFEVRVPASVSCALEGPDRGRPIREWASMGIERVNGRPFPANELAGEGYLLMPAGRFGPAFIVTPNFYVFKQYNVSDLYALFIGHAGDRMEFGGGAFAAAWRDTGVMLRSDIAAMQRVLEGKGYDVGGADGLPGYKTRRSIGEWQAANGFQADCFPTVSTMAKIR